MQKLVCTNVSRIAWNNEEVTLKSGDTTIILHLHNQEEHGQFETGKEYQVVAGETIVASLAGASKKASSKKTSAKKAVVKKTAAKKAAAKTESAEE